MSDSFINKIVSASENIYEVTSVSGNEARMLSVLEWARAQRDQGFHLGIFFVNGVLTVHAPREAQGYEDWLARDTKCVYIFETSYFDRATGTHGPWKNSSSHGRYMPEFGEYYHTEAEAMKDYDRFCTNHPCKNNANFGKHRIVRKTIQIVVGEGA